MLLFKAVLCLLASLQLAQAYYPWFPAYRCIFNGSCTASKPELEAQESPIAERASLKIVQKVPEIGVPHDIHVRDLAARLAKKYQGSPSRTVDNGWDLERRTGATYEIVSAEPPTQTNSAGIDQDGTDYSYFAQVHMGSANTTLYMLLDSGASQSWVMGSTCTSPACEVHNTFGPADSSTYKPTGGEFLLKYGSGNATGTYANDSVSLAGFTLEMTLGIANVTSDDFLSFPIDGILGLAQGPSQQYPTFVETLVASKTFTSNLFAVILNRASDGNGDYGEISFGTTDPSKYTGSFSYTPISPDAQGGWAIPMDSVGFGGKNAGISGKLAYIDTGTSFIFAPQDEVAQFHQTVPGAQSTDGENWSVPCSTTTPLTFTFSGVGWNVASQDWVGPMANGVCTSNVYGSEVVPGQWLLGDTFLKSVYTVFDIDENRIGFAVTKAQSGSAASSSTTIPTVGMQTPSSVSPPGSTTGSPSSTLGVSSGKSSNKGTTGSSTSQAAAAAFTTGQSAPLVTGSSGLNGHQTSDSSETAAAETSTSPSASPTKKSASVHLDRNLPAMLLATFALAVLC